MDHLLRLRVSQAADRDGPDLRDHDHAVPLHRHDVTAVEVLVRHVPDMHGERILRADHVIGPHGDVKDRREGRGLDVEELIAKLLQSSLHALQDRELRERFFDREILRLGLLQGLRLGGRWDRTGGHLRPGCSSRDCRQTCLLQLKLFLDLSFPLPFLFFMKFLIDLFFPGVTFLPHPLFDRRREEGSRLRRPKFIQGRNLRLNYLR